MTNKISEETMVAAPVYVVGDVVATYGDELARVVSISAAKDGGQHLKTILLDESATCAGPARVFTFVRGQAEFDEAQASHEAAEAHAKAEDGAQALRQGRSSDALDTQAPRDLWGSEDDARDDTRDWADINWADAPTSKILCRKEVA